MGPRFAALIALLAVGGAAAAGQQVFRGSVDSVTVDVSVTAGNRPVEGLTAGDFQVSDNGVPQKVLDVSYGTVPIDVTLVVDMSAGGVLQSSVVAAVNKVLRNLRPDDRARVITFDSDVREHAGLAPGNSLAPLAMPAGTLDGLRPRTQTKCYDAIAQSIVTPQPDGRRQIAIVFSAGRDTASSSSPKAVIETARRSTMAVFVVHTFMDLEPTEPLPEGAIRRPTPRDPLAIPSRFFKELAELTGGVVQVVTPVTVMRNDSQRFAARARLNVAGIEASFIRALDDFRSSYLLRYTLQGVPREGWHELDVRVTKPGGRYKVRARKGYKI